MANHVQRAANMLRNRDQIIGHVDVGMCVKPWAVAVIALVHGNHMVLIGQAFCNNTPVARRAIKPVYNQ